MTHSLQHKTTKHPALLTTLLAGVLCVAVNVKAAVPAPRLVIGILVDDLQPQYIDILEDRFGNDGLNRLIQQGVTLSNVDYGTPLDPTAATTLLLTGASPSVNGIDMATRFDKQTMHTVDIFHDPEIIGNYTTRTYSPRAMRVSNLSDEVRIAGGGVTYVYAIAADPQRAIAMGGHAANCAIWLDDNNQCWATSTHYKDVPTIVANRNRINPLVARLDTMSWVPLYDNRLQYPSLPDHVTHYPFRYTYPRGNKARFDAFVDSPLSNREVTDMAIDHITSLSLGTHQGTDMLTIAYDMSPYSHSRTPDNRYEQIDAYHRLDRDIARLFKTIESQGLGANTLIYLAATPPDTRSRNDDPRWQMPYGVFSVRKAISLLNMYLIAIHGNGQWVNGYNNHRLYLNTTLAEQRNIDIRTLRTQTAEFLRKMSGVATVLTVDDIFTGNTIENAAAMRRNTAPGQDADIIIDVLAGWEILDDHNNPGAQPQGRVQRAVSATAPLYIFYPPLLPTTIDTPVDARVIAPTLSRLMRIRAPNAAVAGALNLSPKNTNK